MRLAVKKEVLTAITSNPFESNGQIAERLRLSAQQVSGVRTWYGKKGADYITEIDDQLSKQSHKAGDFTNFQGLGKDEARQTMVSHIDLSGVKKGTILTLPWKNWTIEKMVHNTVSKRFAFDACESDPKVFLEMTANMHAVGSKTNNTVHYGSISDKILSAVEDTYSHCLLDYCGTLEKTRKELLYALSNNIVKVNGTISVTLLKARNTAKTVGKLNAFKSQMTGESVRANDNDSGIKMFFQTLCALTDFEVMEEFSYNDSSPMILIVLKRTK